MKWEKLRAKNIYVQKDQFPLYFHLVGAICICDCMHLYSALCIMYVHYLHTTAMYMQCAVSALQPVKL